MKVSEARITIRRKAVKKTRNAIFAIAALLFISDLITMAASDTFDITTLIISLAIAAVFVGWPF
jgi:hypothetical protein